MSWGTGLQGRARVGNTEEGGQDEGVKYRAGLALSLQYRNSELGRHG